MGYAFINLVDKSYIKDFYLENHNQKWDLFKSGKVNLLLRFVK
jgi:hypothetical protein